MLRFFWLIRGCYTILGVTLATTEEWCWFLTCVTPVTNAISPFYRVASRFLGCAKPKIIQFLGCVMPVFRLANLRANPNPGTVDGCVDSQCRCCLTQLLQALRHRQTRSWFLLSLLHMFCFVEGCYSLGDLHPKACCSLIDRRLDSFSCSASLAFRSLTSD